jgi:hypothetical protein
MPQRARPDATTALKTAAMVLTPLICGLAALGGIGSFATIRHQAQPWFGSSSWIVPVGIDLGILALLAWDLLDEYLGLPWPPLRWTAWTFIAATVYLNVAAAHGNPTAAVMHAAMPVLFITVIEGIRHLIRQATGLADGTRLEPIPAARWLLAPRSSFLLYRHMVLWHVTSYQHGLVLEHKRLLAIARLQQNYGHYFWRWRAPLHERIALRLASAVGADAVPVAAASGEAPSLTPAGHLNDRDRELVTIASAMVRDARAAGATLSQSELARQLRERGLRIANDRLRWLFSTAMGQCSGLPSEPRTGSP